MLGHSIQPSDASSTVDTFTPSLPTTKAPAAYRTCPGTQPDDRSSAPVGGQYHSARRIRQRARTFRRRGKLGGASRSRADDGRLRRGVRPRTFRSGLVHRSR